MTLSMSSPRIVAALLAEFDEEMAKTRRMLEAVPADRLGWKPHDNSFTLGKLANHVAAIPVGAAFVISGRGSKPQESASMAEVLEAFDSRTAATRAALAGSSDEHLSGTMMVTPTVKQTRGSAFQWWISHMVHHRGQLSVYLRLLGAAVPGMYGASADER